MWNDFTVITSLFNIFVCYFVIMTPTCPHAGSIVYWPLLAREKRGLLRRKGHGHLGGSVS